MNILTWKKPKNLHQNVFPRDQRKFAFSSIFSIFHHRNKHDQVFVLPEHGPVLNKTQNPLPRTKSFSSGLDLPIPKLSQKRSSSLCVFDVSRFGQILYWKFKLVGQKINSLIKGGLIWMRDWPGLLVWKARRIERPNFY